MILGTRVSEEEAEGYHEVEKEAQVLRRSVPPPSGKQSRPSRSFPLTPSSLFSRRGTRLIFFMLRIDVFTPSATFNAG
jgi:hypothetical protein